MMFRFLFLDACPNPVRLLPDYMMQHMPTAGSHLMMQWRHGVFIRPKLWALWAMQVQLPLTTNRLPKHCVNYAAEMT